MKNFILDLWNDLREKRLWPIAALLVVALVAVPVLLLKGAPEKAEPPVAAGASQSALPIVSTDGSGIAGSSTLGSFDPKDPFRSRADALAGPDSTSDAASAAAGGATAGDLAGGLESGSDTGAFGGEASGAGSPAGGGSGTPAGGSAGGASSPASSGAGGGSPSPPSGGSGSGGSDRPTPSPAPSPAEPQFYEYALEVDFGRRGNERRYRDVRALDSLPSERNPVVVYLGQTRSNESGFLVNQAIGQQGEGNCVPNRSSCSIVYLRPERTQDDHFFRSGPPNFFTYHLRLIAVRRKLDGREVSARSRATSSERRTKVAGARSTREVRRTAFDFRIPLIAGRRR